ncbi:succinylglutamate desuccinylase [Iodobacter sp. HSC-16F04]|uniref:Succinylglutamate desuccinylase n=1 Tax=Iodobacter violaceini TaxID=3044271 RepID=A0ABX0KZQ6_9NEIS|nr:succinylglutamate desuccinylase [Iodobacter violacea]NHQ87559.1 succinylglutamate desuccinylase [Iodobacter violacea]
MSNFSIEPSFLAQVLAGKTCISLPYCLPNGTHVQVMDEGVIRFEPKDPGDRQLDVVLSCGIHGNETAPVELLDQLISQILDGQLRVRARVLFVFGNVEAMRQGVRCVAQDMNRLFCRLPDVDDGDEARRAAMLEMQLMRFFSRSIQDGKPRLHYDLHTAIHGSLIEKFAIYPLPPHGRDFDPLQVARLACAGVDAVLLQSTTSTTFSFFSSQHCGAAAFTVELGRAMPFGQNTHIDLSKMQSYLEGLISGELPDYDGVPAHIGLYKVSREIIKQSDVFVLRVDAKMDNFTPLPVGTVLAEDGDIQHVVDEDDARMIFPNPYIEIGQRAGLVIVPAKGYSR